MENLNLILLVIIAYLLYKDVKNSNTLENFNPDQFIQQNTDSSGALVVNQDVELSGNLYLNDDFEEAVHDRINDNISSSNNTMSKMIDKMNKMQNEINALKYKLNGRGKVFTEKLYTRHLVFIDGNGKEQDLFPVNRSLILSNSNGFSVQGGDVVCRSLHSDIVVGKKEIVGSKLDVTELISKKAHVREKFTVYQIDTNKITVDQIDTNIVNITGDNNFKKAKKLGDGVIFRDKGQMVIGTDDNLFITNLTNGQNVHINNGNVNCDNLNIKQKYGKINLSGNNKVGNIHVDNNGELIFGGANDYKIDRNGKWSILKHNDQVIIKSGRTGNHLQDNGSNNRYLKGHGTFSNQNRGGHETMTLLRK